MRTRSSRRTMSSDATAPGSTVVAQTRNRAPRNGLRHPDGARRLLFARAPRGPRATSASGRPTASSIRRCTEPGSSSAGSRSVARSSSTHPWHKDTTPDDHDYVHQRDGAGGGIPLRRRVRAHRLLEPAHLGRRHLPQGPGLHRRRRRAQPPALRRPRPEHRTRGRDATSAGSSPPCSTAGAATRSSTPTTPSASRSSSETGEDVIAGHILEEREWLEQHSPERDRDDFERAWAERPAASDQQQSYEVHYTGSPVVVAPANGYDRSPFGSLPKSAAGSSSQSAAALVGPECV